MVDSERGLVAVFAHDVRLAEFACAGVLEVVDPVR